MNELDRLEELVEHQINSCRQTIKDEGYTRPSRTTAQHQLSAYMCVLDLIEEIKNDRW